MSTEHPSETVHHAELPCKPGEACSVVAREAEAWGGEWKPEGKDGGLLTIPVMAGLRYGWVEGRLKAERSSQGGSRLTFRVERSRYRVQRSSALVLAFAAAGALAVLFAPFFPPLWPLVPIGFVLALAAWFFIVSHLRNSGPEEFFETLSEEGAGPDGGDPGDDPGVKTPG